ncbi:hypothetical protein BJY59DRAFT_699447 [Rhodotorula toruloides]
MNRRGLSSTANVHHPHARIDQLHSLTPAKGVQGSAAVDNLLSVHWLLTEVDDDRLAVRLTCDSDVSGMAGRSAQGCLRVRARGVDGENASADFDSPNEVRAVELRILQVRVVNLCCRSERVAPVDVVADPGRSKGLRWVPHRTVRDGVLHDPPQGPENCAARGGRLAKQRDVKLRLDRLVARQFCIVRLLLHEHGDREEDKVLAVLETRVRWGETALVDPPV